MPRVLLLCGSLQRSSANRAALDVARAALSALGIDVTAFDALASIPPLNSDRADDPGDAVLSLRAQLAAADVIAEVWPPVDCSDAREGEVPLALHLPDGTMRRTTGGVRLGDAYDTLVGYVQVRVETEESLPPGTEIYSWEPVFERA